MNTKGGAHKATHEERAQSDPNRELTKKGVTGALTWW